MEKEEPTRKLNEEENETPDSLESEETDRGGFPSDVDFKKALGCGG